MQAFDTPHKSFIACITHVHVYNDNIFLEHNLESIVWLITFTRCNSKIIPNTEPMRLMTQSHVHPLPMKIVQTMKLQILASVNISKE